MFPTLWAFLPWTVFYTLKYLQTPSTFGLFTFGLFTLFSTPSAYAAHQWYPFFGAFILFICLHFIQYRLPLKRYSTIVLLCLLINSFWLLPNIYYLATSSWIPQQNQQNRLHSQEFLLKNRETGTLVDSTLTRGFYLNWDIYNFESNNFEKLMPQWRDHFRNFDVKIIGYLLFIFSFIGLGLAIYQKNKILAFSPFFIIPFILLSNQTIPFNYLFDILLKVPLLSETLRFIFTKVSTLFIFGQTIYLSYFLLNIAKYINAKVLSFIFILCLFIYSFPVFQGFLISPSVRINIPPSYFELNKYFSTLQSGKILTLPLHNPSGWTYNDWGYQGSGFLWWGIPQAVLDRDSDRWSVQNEESYREFYTSLYSSDSKNFAKYLAKFKINYLLWDESVISTAPKNNDQIVLAFQTIKLIQQLIDQNTIIYSGTFGSVKIYSLINSPSLVQQSENLSNIYPAYHWSYFDSAYDNHDYKSDSTQPFITIPNRDIISPLNKVDPSKIVYNRENSTIISFPANEISEKTFLGTLNIFSQDKTDGISLNLDNLPHNRYYLVGIKSNYVSGIPLRFCFKNTTSGLCLLEDELSKFKTSNWDYFLIPKSDEDIGYEVDLSAVSPTHDLSFSQLQEITITDLPSSAFETYIPLSSNLSTNLTSTNFLNKTIIKINSGQLNSDTLILNQSFSSGWIAFYLNCKGNALCLPSLLPNHTLINNWANGWSIPESSFQFPVSIYIFFWPQLLEFLGFGLLIGTFLYIFKTRR